MTDKETIEIIREIKKDNESKSMIIINNTSNTQIRWSSKDLKEMAEITNRCAKENRAIETVLNLIQTQQAEIEEYKKTIAYDNKEYEHMKKSLKGIISKLNAEIEKKDKMIEELKKNNEQMNNNFSNLMHIL